MTISPSGCLSLFVCGFYSPILRVASPAQNIATGTGIVISIRYIGKHSRAFAAPRLLASVRIGGKVDAEGRGKSTTKNGRIAGYSTSGSSGLLGRWYCVIVIIGGDMGYNIFANRLNVPDVRGRNRTPRRVTG